MLFSEVDIVLEEPFLKQNLPNSGFHLLGDTNYTIKFYILSRYTSVATTLTEIVLFEEELLGIL